MATDAITATLTESKRRTSDKATVLRCKEVMVIILLPIPFVETNELRPVRAAIQHIYPIVTNTVSILLQIGPLSIVDN